MVVDEYAIYAVFDPIEFSIKINFDFISTEFTKKDKIENKTIHVICTVVDECAIYAVFDLVEFSIK